MSMVLMEVDDLLIAAAPDYMPKLRGLLQAKFKFEKWVEGGSSVTFVGRTLEMKGDHRCVTFEKYIREESKLVDVAKGRGPQKTESVTEHEKVALRTTVYQFNWLGKECCLAVAGAASLLASRLEQTKIEDIFIANAAVRVVKNTASMALKLLKFKSMDDIILVSFSDCAGPGST